MPWRRSVLRLAYCASGILLAPALLPAQEGRGPRNPAGDPTPVPELSDKVHAYIVSAATTLDPRPRSVLRRIPDQSRRMLAIAHYLQKRHLVDELWAWSPRDARSYQRTEGYRNKMAELRQVKRTFAALNPGYALVADTNGRSLPAQLRLWNREISVTLAAREFLDSCRVWLAHEVYPSVPDSTGLARFLGQVLEYQSFRPPTVAVPGLSLHGRLRAIDFAILRGRRVVAGTRSASIETAWDSAGWTERLKQAVTLSGSRLAGPMESPREPWHYERLVEP